MTILDLDLDAFVQPPVISRRKGDPRPQDDAHTLYAAAEVTGLLCERWQVRPETPLVLLEDHDEILEAVSKLIGQGRLQPPFHWVHVDAHDDFYGHYSRPTTCANFMYEVIRRGWPSTITWSYPPDYAGGPPDYIYDQNRLQIVFDRFRIPIWLEPMAKLKLKAPPDFAFLCRSSEFSPAKADALYDHIAAQFTVTTP